MGWGKFIGTAGLFGAYGTGAGIVISMVFYGSHIILLSAAALQHYGH